MATEIAGACVLTEVLELLVARIADEMTNERQ